MPTEAFQAWEAAHRNAALAEQELFRKISSRNSLSDEEFTQLQSLWKDASNRLKCMLQEMRSAAEVMADRCRPS